MKIIKFPDEQNWYFRYALIIFENYKDISDKLEVDIVCTLLNDRWYSKLFINKWWYIPFVMLNTPRHFMIKYVHGWYDIQFHDLCLGFINLHWEGSPGINKKRKKEKRSINMSTHTYEKIKLMKQFEKGEAIEEYDYKTQQFRLLPKDTDPDWNWKDKTYRILDRTEKEWESGLWEELNAYLREVYEVLSDMNYYSHLDYDDVSVQIIKEFESDERIRITKNCVEIFEEVVLPPEPEMFRIIGDLVKIFTKDRTKGNNNGNIK